MIIIAIIVIVTSIIVYMRKKLTQQYEVGGKSMNNNELHTHNYIIVDQRAITDNPAYEKGMYYISLFIYDMIILQYIDLK